MIWAITKLSSYCHEKWILFFYVIARNMARSNFTITREENVSLLIIQLKIMQRRTKYILIYIGGFMKNVYHFKTPIPKLFDSYFCPESQLTLISKIEGLSSIFEIPSCKYVPMFILKFWVRLRIFFPLNISQIVLCAVWSSFTKHALVLLYNAPAISDLPDSFGAAGLKVGKLAEND